MRMIWHLLMSLLLASGCSLIVEEGGDPMGTQTQGDSLTDSLTNSASESVDTGVETSPSTDETDTWQSTDPSTGGTDPITTDELVVAAMTIDKAAEYTTRLSVEILSDVSNASEMRMRNGVQEWSPWMPFKVERSWVLPPQDGKKTVSAEYRNRLTGQVASASDSITLDQTPPAAPLVELVGDYYTKNTTAVFQWESGGMGGNGNFRAKVDSEDFSMDALYTSETIAVSPNLPNGRHTAYVQEQDDAGHWSASGKAEVHVDLVDPAILSFGRKDSSDGQVCSYTFDTNIVLNLEAADHGGSGLKDMQLRNEQGQWTDWIPVSNAIDWPLLPGFGKTTVEIQLRDNVNNVNTMQWQVYRDDPYEQCSGNDTTATAWILLDELAYGYTGPILRDGTALLGERSDFYRIVVPDWSGGTLRASLKQGSTSSLELAIYDQNGNWIESGMGSPGEKEIFLGGYKDPNTPQVCDECYCYDAQTHYYVEVRPSNPESISLPYEIWYFDQSTACGNAG